MRVFYTNKFWYALVLFIMLAAVAYFFHNNTLKNYPQSMHAWTQTDHFALVKGFINNNLDILHPETYNLMPNLEAPTEMETSITAVDFPLVEYISAAIMKAFGLSSPLTYRIISIILSVIALIFLYLITWRLRIPALVGFLLTMILACSPIYIFYQAAILPTVPAFMFACGAVYFYLFFLEKNNLTFLLISILFITIASGIRKPFFIFFAALFIHHLYLSSRKQKKTATLIVWILGFAALASHQLYQSYLTSKYGSAFLGSLMPAGSFSEFIELSKTIFNTWKYHLYNKGVNLLLFGSATWFFVRLYYQKLNKLQENFLELLLLFISAAFLYYLVLQKQFINHDYYFIDVLYLPFSLMLILFISHINLKLYWKENVVVLILTVVFFWAIFDARAMHAERKKIFFGSHIEKERLNFTNSDKYLDSIGIAKDARMLCLNTSSTNSPLMLMDRKGYTIHKNRRPYLEMAMQWPHEHIVIQNQYLLSHTAAVYPELLTLIKREHSNGKISLFKKENMTNQSLENILGIRNIQSIIADKPDESYCVTADWFKTLEKDSSFYLSAPYSSFVPENKLFPANLTIDKNEIYSDKSFVEFIWKSNLFFNDLRKQVDVVFKIDWQDSTYTSSHYNILDIISETNKWKNVQILFPVPELEKVKTVSVYFWNPNNNAFWMDDTEINLYENTFE